MSIIVESHNKAFFSKISANFQSDTSMNIADLLELIIQKKPFPVQMPIKSK